MRKYLETLHALQLKAFDAGLNMEFGVREANTDMPWITGYIWNEAEGLIQSKRDFHFYDFEDEDRRGAEIKGIEDYIDAFVVSKRKRDKENLVREYLKKLQDLQTSIVGTKVHLEIDTRYTDDMIWLSAGASVERANQDDEFVSKHHLFSPSAECWTAEEYRKQFEEQFSEIEAFIEEHK